MTLAQYGALIVNPSVIGRDLGDESVLLDLDTGVYYGLNRVGSRVWTLLTERRTLGEIGAIVADEYEVATDVLERDLCRLVDDLRARGLVTCREAGT